MQGVVSLLDDTHQAMVEHLQARLERVLGVPGLCQTPVAHVSYHVAEEYEPQRLAATLLSFAASNMRFRVHTSGFGLFNHEHPVLYIPVVRSPLLSTQHHVLWRQLDAASTGVSPHYHPDHWVPHITIADRPDLPDYLPDITRLLSLLNLTWEIELTNVALLYGQGQALEVMFRHELLAADRPGHSKGPLL